MPFENLLGHATVRRVHSPQAVPGLGLSNCRWSEWAQRLIQRYRRLSARQRFAGLLLRHSPVRFRDGCKCSAKTSLTLFQQAHQRFLPITREVLYREQRTFLPSIRPVATSGGNRFINRHWVEPPSHESRRLTERDWVEPWFHKSRAVLASQNERVADSEQPPSLGLRFVQRVLQVDELERKYHRNEVTQRDSAPLLRRTAQRTRRVEGRATGDLPLVTRRGLSMRPLEPATSDITSQNAIGAARAESNAPARNLAQQPEMNIETLADHVIRQIDHRITAWKERMGRF
jgi:hypothetical protein